MMQNTVTCVILTIISMILTASVTPTKKLSITEMAIPSDQNAEILKFRHKFDVFYGFPDIFPDCGPFMQVITKTLLMDLIGVKTTEEDIEKAAGLSS